MALSLPFMRRDTARSAEVGEPTPFNEILKRGVFPEERQSQSTFHVGGLPTLAGYAVLPSP